LGIGLALAHVGDSATQDADTQSIRELVTWLNDNFGIYGQQQELAEALMTLWKINDVKATEGENPAMRRALASVGHTVTALAEKLFAPAEPAKATNASRLQVAKNSADFAIFRRQNDDWLQVYHKRVSELVKLVVRVENFSVA
jgi:hypothetical protein